MAHFELNAPPHLSGWREEVARLLHSLQGLPDLVGFSSSGSSGRPPKMILFRREALEHSARSAVEHLDAWEGDWCCPLPVYHVGGAMIFHRAQITGARVCVLKGKWDAARYAELIEENGCAWSSLVPTQVVDLVHAKIPAPTCLRGIVVGGGRLEKCFGEQARRLGWPVVQSYGMTEAASQVATTLPTEPFENDWLPILPHRKVTIDECGLLSLDDAALFCGIVTTNDEGKFSYVARDISVPWKSRDIVELQGDRLHFIRRSDRLVKLMGELVDLDAIESALSLLAPDCALVTLPHPRRGVEIIACGEDEVALQHALDQWNAEAPGFQRIECSVCLHIPRNTMGKTDRSQLHASVRNMLLA